MRIGFIYWGKMFCSHFTNVCYRDIENVCISEEKKKRALNMRATLPPTQKLIAVQVACENPATKRKYDNPKKV